MDLITRPLTGVTVRAVGRSPALRVAVERLRALGCHVETVAVEGTRRGGGDDRDEVAAGVLTVIGVPFPTSGTALPECRIGWAGPVAVPLAAEHDVQAACGIMHVHGRAAGAPRALPLDYAGACAGILAVQAVCAGVLALLRGGPAMVARTSVAQAALLAVGQYIAVATANAEAEPELGPGAGPCLAADSSTESEGTRFHRGPFVSADGVRFEIETFDAERWRCFWAELDAAHAGIAAGWPAFQGRFATATCPLPAGLAAAAAAARYADIRAAGERSGVSVVPVRAADAPLPAVPASPWRLRVSPIAGLGLGLSPMEPGATAPLAGLRVVEATSRLQGPLAGHVLGLLGAEVIRVEPPGGDPMRGVPPMAGDRSARFQALNRGKDAVEADLKCEAGRRAVLRLAATADVFLHNWPPGRAARLGLGHDDLAAVRPSLVYAHASGWAECLPAPQPMATDYLVQAHCGIADLIGAPGEPPAPSLFTLTDVLGGLISAEGVIAALLARARTGSGVGVETALVDAARLLRGLGRTAVPAAGPPADPPRAAAATVVTDLAEMAYDPAFSAALDVTRDAIYVRPPWTFSPVAATQSDAAAGPPPPTPMRRTSPSTRRTAPKSADSGVTAMTTNATSTATLDDLEAPAAPQPPLGAAQPYSSRQFAQTTTKPDTSVGNSSPPSTPAPAAAPPGRDHAKALLTAEGPR